MNTYFIELVNHLVIHKHQKLYLTMLLSRKKQYDLDLDWLANLIKAITMVVFTFAAFIALVELKSELKIDIFPNIDIPLDEISSFLLGR